MQMHSPTVTRFKKNLILTRKDVPYPVATVHNAGIVKYNDRYVMLFRSHLLNGRSIIGKAAQNKGYVPNVVYSCGAIIYNDELVIPYAMSDINSGIATVVVNELLDCMHAVA
jgi:predicted GH43/DUF377 family glycosyl hydrolase